MGIFGKVFGKKMNNARVEVKKIENRDLMEAMVGGTLLVAFADGDCEEEELKKIDELLGSHKSLQHFGSEVSSTIQTFTQRLKAGYRVGRMEILREIQDVKGDQREKEDVLLAMITVAEADGEIEPEEEKELNAVSQALGLRLSDYA